MVVAVAEGWGGGGANTTQHTKMRVTRLDRRAQQPQLAQLRQEIRIARLVAVGHQHGRLQLLLAERARRVADHTLVVRELALEAQRVLPIEVGQRTHGARPRSSSDATAAADAAAHGAATAAHGTHDARHRGGDGPPERG
jgi:hypothetical protein